MNTRIDPSSAGRVTSLYPSSKIFVGQVLLHRYRRILIILLLFGSLLCGSLLCGPIPVVAQSPNWERFQNGGQMLTKAKLPREWSPEVNMAWTADIPGYGQSSPIVARDQVVVTSTSGVDKDSYHVCSFSLSDGTLNWQVDLANPSPFKNTPMVSRAAPSAVATESRFVGFFEGGLLVGIDPTGEITWKRDLVSDYGKIEARHGIAASLETDGNRVYVWVERGEDPYLLAIAPESGETIWKSAGVGSTAWGSPRLVNVAGGQHLVCSASGKIIGIEPATGQRLWRFDDIANNSSNTPTPAGEGLFLIGASEGRGESASGNAAESNGMIQVSKTEDGSWRAEFKWRAGKATSSFGSPIVAGDTAAFVNRAGVLYRLDLETGEQLSVDRTAAGGIWATPLVVGDFIYIFGYKGTTSVVSLADGKEVAVNRCWPEAGDGDKAPGFGGGNVLYAAASAGEKLLIRRGDKLYAIAE